MNTTKYDELNLSTLKYNDLQRLCKKEGLKANGKKVDLIASLSTVPILDLENDSVSENLTLEDTELENTVLYPADVSQPVFGDISNIMINSPFAKRPGKRKFANAKSNIDKENSKMLALASSSTSTAAPTNVGQLQRLTESRRNGEKEMENLLKQLEEPARKVVEFIEQKKLELDECRTTGEHHYRKLLEEQLKEKERELIERHRNEMKILKSQTEARECDLMNKLNEAIKEANKLQEQKSSLQNKLDVELQNKDEKIKSCTANLKLFKEQVAIKDEEIAALNAAVEKIGKDNETQKKDIEDFRNSLKECEAEKSTLQTQVHHLTEKMSLKDTEIKHQLELMQTVGVGTDRTPLLDTLEDELTCIICQELFVTASTLPCAHSFCEMCLRTWFKTKKSCPVCRADVTLKVVFSVVLDSVIDYCVEKSSDEVKRKRTILLRERNEQKRTADAAADPHLVKNMFHRAGALAAAAPVSTVSSAATSAASAGSSGRSSGASSNGSSTERSGGFAARGRPAVDTNRRRSRSVSPRRNIVNRALQAINYSINRVSNNSSNQLYQPYGVRCFNCGRNHHVRDCQYARPPHRR